MGIAIRGYSLATAEVFLTVWEQDSRTLGTTFPDAGDTIPSGWEFFMNAV